MKKFYLTITRNLSVFIILVAAVIFINYYYNLPGLQMVVKYCQVNFNTAICFLLLGICLFFSDVEETGKTRRGIINIISLIILIIGGVGLIELILNVNFGIDTLFYPSADPAILNGASPRMDPLISSLFIFLSIIFFLLPKRKWHLFIRTINGTGRGVYKMFYLVVSACLQDIQESVKVALQISMRIRKGIADPGLGGKVDDEIKL